MTDELSDGGGVSILCITDVPSGAFLIVIEVQM